MTISIDEVIGLLNADSETRLTELEEKILRLAWDGSTYGQMAIELHYQENYLRNIAKELWPAITRIFGESITKINFNSSLKNRNLTPSQTKIIRQVDSSDSDQSIPEPHYGPIPLASSLYLERPPLEDLACAEIRKPGGVVRIKAPAKTGKTSLLIRVLQAGKNQGYRIVNLNLAQVDRDILSDLNRFLRWLCSNTSRQLGLTPLLADYWDEDAGAKVSCSNYFCDYLLAQIQTPLVIALDEAHQLFEYPHIVRDFFPLLRSWHEDSKIIPIWQKLRLIIVYSTEIYVQLRLNQSPFNIGLTLNLPDFNRTQVLELVQRYGIDWSDVPGQEKLTALMQIIGGHPHYLHLALYHLRWLQADLETLLSSAPTAKGLYGDHLRYLSLVLQDHPELVITWVRVIESPTPVPLDAIAAYKLESLGLIKWLPTGVIPRNDLYRRYFRQELPLNNNYTLTGYISQLEQENQRLWELCFIDDLTGLGNQAGFERTLTSEWRRSARTSGFISVIFCEIDNFDSYEDLGNSQSCVKTLVEILTESARRAADYLAHYQGSQFAILLPDTNREGAETVAEKIQTELEKIGLFTPKLTISIGCVTRGANFQSNPNSLTTSAQQALQQAQSLGGNQIIIGD
jgi:diguanylate cyclase (GGDEF)-like protein